MSRRIVYTDPNCNQYEVASCGSCGTPAPAPCDTCPKCPSKPSCHTECATCVEAQYGVSQLGQGLQYEYVVGLGNEDRVMADGQLGGNGSNFIHWSWLDPSIVDPTKDFVPRVLEQRCDGKKLVATDRNTLQLQNPNGQILQTWTNPFSALNTLTTLQYRLTDTNPYLSQVVSIPAGNPVEVRAGVGIDLEAIPGGGFKIINTSVIEPTAIQRASNSGITLTGTGTGQSPYVIGIDCGTLRGHCGFVTSVNGQVPDENGNLIVASGSTGVSSILPDPANILTFTPAGSGILQAGISCANLKANCGLLDTNSMIPLTRISQTGATTGQVPVWNGTNWVATTPSVGTSVQYQEEGTNTGSANPTVINFTGTGVTASQTGGVVTVNVAGGSSSVAPVGGISFIIERDGVLPAGNDTSSISTTFDSVFAVNNTLPSSFAMSGNNLTIQQGKYLVEANVEFELRTDSGTASTVYVFDCDAALVIGTALSRSQWTRQNVPLPGGIFGYSLDSGKIVYILDVTTATTVDLSTATSACGMSRAGSFSTTAATIMRTTQYVTINKLA